MDHDRLISGVAAALAVCAVVLAVLAVVYNLAILVIAAAVGAAAYFMWYQASGRLAARVYRSVEDRARQNNGRGESRSRTRETGGFGAGPREDWTAPGGRGGRRTSGGQRRAGRQGQRQRRRARQQTDGPSEAEAYSILGVEVGADDETVKAAYRQKVKEVHPDTAGGDEDEFKRVNAAYERLT
ncbi:J domain-containing protein [Halorientalis halophila]|uniref:J domain-containing protein n=1 Tax=Halorientalis halophila TaxID=3108499 RepID=UPI0030093BD9